MHTRRSIALLLALASVVAVVAAACSSSPKATPEYSKGVTVFFTPDGGKAPVLPASFVNCTYGKVTAADRAAMSKVTSSSSASDLPDATGVRLTRAANQCDATLTNQLIETSVFTGAPASISASQKSCATTKIIAGHHRAGRHQAEGDQQLRGVERGRERGEGLRHQPRRLNRNAGPVSRVGQAVGRPARSPASASMTARTTASGSRSISATGGRSSSSMPRARSGSGRHRR